MAKLEMFKGKDKQLVSLIDVEGWARAGYKVKQEAYDSLCNDSEKEYAKRALKRAASATAPEEGE